MRKAALLLSGLLCGCAVNPAMPPARFQALGTTTVVFSSDPATDCQIGNATACTLGKVVIVPDPCQFPNDFYALLLCHENAHRFGGWEHQKE